jgi:hypothetical protein
VSQGKAACLNTAKLCQHHQFFVWCSVEPGLGVEAIDDMLSLKLTCRLAFEGIPAAPRSSVDAAASEREAVPHGSVSEGRGSSRYSIDMIKPGANGCHPAEVTASAAAGPRSRERALL